MNTVSNNTEMNAILKEFARGNHKNSYLKIKEYLKRFPNDLVARYNSGVIAEKNKDIETAIESYLIVIKSSKDHWQSRNNLYLIYFHLKNYNKALKLVDEVLNIKPNYQSLVQIEFDYL